jgi:hypothetical protein
VRFVQNADCSINIMPVEMTSVQMGNFGEMWNYLVNTGIVTPDRKALVFSDGGPYCGIANISSDDQKTANNWANTIESVARVDENCWSANVAEHEMTHTMGGVQHSAPHSSANWHCGDDYDVMCYNDGSIIVSIVCPDPALDNLEDCNDDDYFNTNPPPDNYLATHWSVSDSRFLAIPGDVTPTPVPPTETPIPPTETPVPPTETPIPPTETPIPPTPSPTVTPEPGNPTLDLNKDAVRAGKKVHAVATGFDPGSTVKFLLGSRVLGRDDANRKGVASDQLTIPADTKPGVITITATNGTDSAEATITVTPKDAAAERAPRSAKRHHHTHHKGH